MTSFCCCFMLYETVQCRCSRETLLVGPKSCSRPPLILGQVRDGHRKKTTARAMVTHKHGISLSLLLSMAHFTLHINQLMLPVDNWQFHSHRSPHTNTNSTNYLFQPLFFRSQLLISYQIHQKLKFAASYGFTPHATTQPPSRPFHINIPYHSWASRS